MDMEKLSQDGIGMNNRTNEGMREEQSKEWGHWGREGEGVGTEREDIFLLLYPVPACQTVPFSS
jgi:hypothetical protein